jgi:Immunity protein 40
MAFTEEANRILESGFSLSNIGIENWALSKEQALVALEDLTKLNATVLGGDVVQFVQNVPRLTYDNWFCEIEDGESTMAFAIRSLVVAKSFINGYRNLNVREPFFALVLSKTTSSA